MFQNGTRNPSIASRGVKRTPPPSARVSATVRCSQRRKSTPVTSRIASSATAPYCTSVSLSASDASPGARPACASRTRPDCHSRAGML